VGRSPARLDGAEKVSGRALYLDDIRFEGQLWGRTVRSNVAHGLIKEIRFDAAYDWTGITRVTATDIPGDNVIHLIEDDQPCLAERMVRHCEEPIALIAANDRERLDEALQHVRVEIEPLEPVLDPLKSPRDFKKFLIERNVEGLANAFANAHRVVEGTYVVRHQEQMYIEPNAVCATPRDDGGVTLHGSMQCPYYVHRALQRLLRLDQSRIAVIQTVTGGGFGGKEEYPSMIACHAALLARKAGRPVKMVYRRDEDIAATTKRHPALVKHRTAVAQDGALLGCEIEIVMDGGAYCTLSPVVASRGVLHAGGAYRWPACRIQARVVATNTPPNGAFRGFGVPQTIFAMETHMEKIAAELGMDPFELRRKNAYLLGDETPTGQKLKWSVAAHEVLESAAARSQYTQKRARFAQQKSGRKRRGIGLSLALHGAGFTGGGEVKLKSRAGVELTPRGARVLSISTDIGQGTITIFAQMAAEALGISIDDVEVALPDSSRMPDSGPTVASRTCMVVGGTIAKAAEEMARILRAYAAALHQVSEKDVTCSGGVFYGGGRALAPFAQVAEAYLREHRALQLIEQYAQPPGIEWDEHSYRGDAYVCFAWSGTAVEVAVDLDTGEVQVERVVQACDIGKAIHPILCEGQVEGGVVQALGYALLEELVLKDGRPQNTRMQNYVIPTSLDAPHIETILIENPYPHGPHGAKGLGELPMDGPAPAVAAAILNATGVLVPELPITPDRLLRLLEGGR
jgi:CO/xanthine dehydrogenase Mo-binding subunit